MKRFAVFVYIYIYLQLLVVLQFRLNNVYQSNKFIYEIVNKRKEKKESHRESDIFT